MNIKIKTTSLILATVLTLPSCSQEDLPSGRPAIATDRKITFYSSLPALTTKAQETTVNDLDHFRVTAFDPADNDLITDGILREYVENDTLFKDQESGKFFAEDIVWPEVGKEDHVLHFFSYHPDLPSDVVFDNQTTVVDGEAVFNYSIGNFKVAADISKQIDFMTAYTSGSMEEKEFSGISLTFQHKLSRIEVKAKSGNKSCKLEIAGIRIGGIHTRGTYNFKALEDAGDWTLRDEDKGNVEYIFGNEDKIVALDNTTEAVSIMGGSKGINYAMLLPSSHMGWDFANDHTNENKGLYLSVLLRVLDKTPGGNDKQQYPYYDNSQGLNAMNIPRVVLAVDNDGKITANFGELYKDINGKYYTDATKTTEYTCTVPDGSTVKEFGWAALPVTGEWEAGKAYTYTLDYTYGVGLHDPSVQDPQSGSGSAFPGLMAGDPIISDRVGVTVTVNGWQGGEKTTHDFIVPGS